MFCARGPQRDEARRVNYAANPLSMMHTSYNCSFFSAVKPGGDKDPSLLVHTPEPGAVPLI